MSAYSVGPAPAAGVRRLHLNEFRGAHSPAVLAALAVPTDPDIALRNYQAGPDPALAAALAEYVGAPDVNHVLVAAGSDEVLRAIVDTAHCRGHRCLIMGEPGYTHFRHYAELRELRVSPYYLGVADAGVYADAAPLRYHAPDMAAGCLVYICHPNNPTGHMWREEDVDALAAEFPRSTFLVDEAYVEFASADVYGEVQPDRAMLNAASMVRVAMRRPNVVVTRTMSKAFGLAAMRIGYAVGTPDLLTSIAVAVSPKAMNPSAAAAACAALRDVSHYASEAIATLHHRRDCANALTGLGYWVRFAPANFFLVYVGDTCAAVARLAAAGIAVRDRTALPGLAGFVRVTAGNAEDCYATIAAFAALMQTLPSSPIAPTKYGNPEEQRLLVQTHGEWPPQAKLGPPQLLYTPKATVAEVKTLMRRVVAVLRDGGVEFWAQSGTMLGMFRHCAPGNRGGMIPWDDDGDLAYLREPDADSVGALGAAFAAAGLTLQRNRTDAYWQVGTNAPGATISPVHIDVFSYRRDPDGGYTLEDSRFAAEEPDSGWAHCNTRYGAEELFPLDESWYFYDVPIPMPRAAEAVLRRSLGADFMTRAKIRCRDGSLYEFELTDYSPA